MAATGAVAGPGLTEVKFFLGTHQPHWVTTESSHAVPAEDAMEATEEALLFIAGVRHTINRL